MATKANFFDVHLFDAGIIALDERILENALDS